VELKNFEKLSEMHDQQEFEKKLEEEVSLTSPVLFSLLHANFLILVQYETQNTEQTPPISLFDNGKLLPYSDLLMIDRRECLANAKMLLPFWYAIPVISWIVSLFVRKPNGKRPTKAKQKQIRLAQQNESEKDAEELHAKKPVSRKTALVQAAARIESELVPSESTLQRELDAYRKQWNKMITKEANSNLTEDVNMLIRDYLRKVIKTLNAVNFTIPRINNLADTLARTPNMRKIKEEDSLRMYIKLYILLLIKNMK
jgi:hypothetical protein